MADEIENLTNEFANNLETVDTEIASSLPDPTEEPEMTEMDLVYQELDEASTRWDANNYDERCSIFLIWMSWVSQHMLNKVLCQHTKNMNLFQKPWNMPTMIGV